MRTMRNLVCLIAVGVLLAGGSPARAEAAPPRQGAAPPEADRCTSTGWQVLDVVPETTAEVPFVPSMTACTNASVDRTWIANGSKAVWTIQAPDPSRIEQLTTGDRLESFRLIMGSRISGVLLLPDTSVAIPTPPGNVRWTLDPGMSAAWLAHDKAIDTVEDRYRAEVAKLFSEGSRRREALITCTFEAVDIGNDVLTQDDPTEDLIKNLASGTRDCAKSWRAADESAIRAAGETPPRRWVFPLRSWRSQTVFMRQADSLLADVLKYGGRALHGH